MPELEERSAGKLIGEHWIDKTGYCKADDGPCDLPQKEARDWNHAL